MKNFVMFILLLATLAVTPMFAQAGVEDRLFDFQDAYYLQNGVDPTRIFGRRQVTGDGRSVFDAPNFWFQRNVRAARINPARASASRW